MATRNSSRSLRLGVAVVGVEDQQLLPCFADALSEASPALQIRCDGWVLELGDIPDHHLPAPDIDHQVEVQPDSANGGMQIRDVPTPHLIGSCSPKPWHAPGFLWWPCPTPTLELAVGMEHPVKVPLGTDV